VQAFFSLFCFLFPEVGENFLASREAKIFDVGHAGNVVVAVFNRRTVDVTGSHDALNASIRNVEVEVTFL
jgi:hypothetical protein